jgi:alkylation response protein AidB-like acyl-CoA dehydrogenase
VSAGKKIAKMGLRTSPFSELMFDDVWVPDEAVLGGVGGGAGVFTHSMDWERICLFAAHVGQMERLMERAISYARTRKVGGQPIGKFQAVSHKIADMKVRLEAARLLTYQAASRLEKSRGVSLDASITKLYVSEALVETAADVVQILGGLATPWSTRLSGPCAMRSERSYTLALRKCSETSLRRGWDCDRPRSI